MALTIENESTVEFEICHGVRITALRHAEPISITAAVTLTCAQIDDLIEVLTAARDHVRRENLEVRHVAEKPAKDACPCGSGLSITHGENFSTTPASARAAVRHTTRFWCEKCVPMSGHYEHCPNPCDELVAARAKGKK